MSLFPAYTSENKAEDGSDKPSSSVSCKDSTWLENKSFHISNQNLTSIQCKEPAENKDFSEDSCSDSSGSEKDCRKQGSSPTAKGKEQIKSKKFKKEHGHKKSKDSMCLVLDFTGKEEFYVDKKGTKQYNSVKTLHKPACPRYRKSYRIIGKHFSSWSSFKQKRYYRYCSEIDQGNQATRTNAFSLAEEDYVRLMGELNRGTLENSKNLKNWLELVTLQDRNPYKWSRLTVAEKKLAYLQKALTFHTGQDELYKVYIDVITQAYTSHDVSKMLETLLQKDPYSLILWQALIMCTQGTMARCTVPEVLRIYERCMKKMFHNHKQTANVQVSDDVMMQLFYNCCLFLRQAGLYEQFIALIKLAIELNVASSSKILNDMQPTAEDEQALVEYEEIVLQSGLPMNEIWLRTEKLRQSFNFLPYAGSKLSCSDPQRIVFNEDICHYVYPLKSQENTFKLLITILRLLKLPFVTSHTLGNQLQGDTDAIEDLLALFVLPHYICSLDQHQFFASLFDLSKTMVSTPTFLCNTIAHERYSQTLKNLLLNFAQSYEQIDERKRLIFLQLWCRFERFLLKQEKLNGKLACEYVQQARKRFKVLLKQRQNRNCLQLYVEYALFELEADTAAESIENVLKNLLEAYDKDENLHSELAFVYLTYAEICIKWRKYDQASQLLSLYALNLEPGQLENVTNAKKLAAVTKMKEKLDNTINIERSVEIMLLEQHFLNDFTLSQIGIYCYLRYTLQQKQHALEYLHKLLEIFQTKSNQRHVFLKEHIYEIYIKILQLPERNCYVSHKLMQDIICKAFGEYPNNLYILQKWGCQQSLPWYKLRAGYIKMNPSIKSVIFIITLARCRFINSLSFDASLLGKSFTFPSNSNDIRYQELLVRQRILNLFRELLPNDTNPNSGSSLCLYSSLRRNSLFWRCYLSCLSDQSCSFELGEKCLLTALDECPWSKALYIDGATYVPQQLPHLQDLIIEKQLRIYALPEELEILRQR